MAIGMFLLGAVTAIIGVRRMLFAWSMRHWPATQGEVRSSEVLKVQPLDARESEMYRPEIRYAFTVDGKEYTGVRRALLTMRYSGPKPAADVVARYPVGGSVTVYYDPVNPRESILIRETALPWAVFITALGLFFSGACARWLLR